MKTEQLGKTFCIFNFTEKFCFFVEYKTFCLKSREKEEEFVDMEAFRPIS